MFDKGDYLKYIFTFEVYASIVLVLTVGLVYMLLLFIANVLIYIYVKQQTSEISYEVDKESTILVDSMLTNYSKIRSTIEIFSLAVNRNWLIYDRINKAIDRYQMSGDIDSFDIMNESDSERLGMVTLLIKKDIGSRNGLYQDLIGLKEIFSKQDRYNLKNYGMVKNGSLIVNLGTMVFFPVFAGIGFNVIKFAGFKLNESDVYSILLIISIYLILANYINFRYSKSEILIKFFNIGITSFIALSVLRIVILASGFMLR